MAGDLILDSAGSVPGLGIALQALSFILCRTEWKHAHTQIFTHFNPQAVSHTSEFAK